MIFFDPRPAFLGWLKAHVGDRPVFDVGCGEGAFLARMWKKKIKAMGIEPRAFEVIKRREILLRTLCQDARECSTLRDFPGVVMFCRPNHTGWVAQTVPLIHADSEILYVSKPGNRYIDLPGFRTERLAAPGCREEYVYRVVPPFPDAYGEADYAGAGAERLLALLRGDGLDFK